MKDYRMTPKRGESAVAYALRLIEEASARVGEGHHQMVRELLEQAGRVAATLSAAKARRIHDRIEYVERKRASAVARRDGP